MTLQQLEYVWPWPDHGQFLKAAEACEVTQPTLSSMIQKLEEELGAKLFDRRSKPVVPTAVGRVVVEQARELLSGARRLRDRVDEQQNAVSGEFRVAVLPTIAPYLLPRFLPEFSRKYPQVDLQISEMKTADVKRALAKGEIDAAIVAQLNELEEFNADTLFYEQYFVYSSQSSELHTRDSVRTTDLREVPLWLLDEGHCFRDQLVSFCLSKQLSAVSGPTTSVASKPSCASSRVAWAPLSSPNCAPCNSPMSRERSFVLLPFRFPRAKLCC